MQNYRKKQVRPMTPWVEGMDMTGVSVSQPDIDNGSPMDGDMIAVNPNDESDKWLVAAKFFTDNYESVEIESGNLTFGHAIAAAKAGHKVARKGWNGKGMFAYIVPAASYPAQTDMIKSVFGDDLVPYRAYWALKTAQGDVATWAPSGSDSIAEDWCIVE